jgi:MFS family permease
VVTTIITIGLWVWPILAYWIFSIADFQDSFNHHQWYSSSPAASKWDYAKIQYLRGETFVFVVVVLIATFVGVLRIKWKRSLIAEIFFWSLALWGVFLWIIVPLIMAMDYSSTTRRVMLPSSPQTRTA